MAQTSTHPALGFFTGRQLTPATAAALRVVGILAKWEERRRTRRGLGRLDPHLLKDVGLTPHDVAREMTRPMWRD